MSAHEFSQVSPFCPGEEKREIFVAFEGCEKRDHMRPRYNLSEGVNLSPEHLYPGFVCVARVELERLEGKRVVPSLEA